jgi:hypothetical protein
MINKYSFRNNPNIIPNGEGYIGWGGIGGSTFQWHPELKIGFSYVPTLFHFFDIHNTKSTKLQEAVVNCIRELNKK